MSWHYNVSYILKHRQQAGRNICFVKDKTAVFALSEFTIQSSAHWTPTTPVNDRILLTPLEHLVGAIGVYYYCMEDKTQTRQNAAIFKQDLIDLLTVAIDAGYPIAHYYMAKTLEFFDGDTANKKQIQDHYFKATEKPLAAYPPKDVEQFNQWMSENTYQRQSPQKTFAEILQLPIQYYGLADLELLEMAQRTNSSQEKASIYLSLGYRHENRLAMKFYLLAGCYGDKVAPQKIQTLPLNYASFAEPQLIFLRDAVLEQRSDDAKLKLLDLFITINEIYGYLFVNKDKTSFIGKGEETRQNLRQKDFLQVLALIGERSSDELKSHIENTNAQFPDKKAAFFDGSEYPTLRQQLLIALSRAGNDFELLRSAAQAFNRYFTSQLHFDGSFPFVLHAKHMVEAQDLERVVAIKPAALEPQGTDLELQGAATGFVILPANSFANNNNSGL